jgi:uncharacterized membrane protein YbhN (UPF0104 family)
VWQSGLARPERTARAAEAAALMRFGQVSVSPYVTGVLRLVVVPAGLLWVFTHTPEFGLSNTISLRPTWIVLALVMNQMALLIFAARMRLVLGVWDVRIDWISAVRIHFQSLFYFVAVPMTVGMEISRFIKIRTIDPSVPKAALAGTLLIDRVIGALAALGVALLCLPWLKFDTALPIAPHWLWIGLATVLVLALTALAWPASWRLIGKLRVVTQGRQKGLLAALALGLVMNVVFSFAIELAAIGLGAKISFLETMFAVSASMLLIAIPVSFAGLGPADAGAAALLITLGCDVRSAVIVGVLPYAGRLIAAVQGGVWEFFDGGKAAFLAVFRSSNRPSIAAPTPMGE